MSQALYFPTTVLMGRGSIQMIPNELSKIEGTKALVVTDDVLIKVGVAQKVLDVLDEAGVEYAVYSDVKPNPTVKNVTDGLQCLKENNCDFVISIGGGSPQDAAKGIAILATNPGDLVEYEGVNKTANKSLPIIAVNTTAGTASEATINYVITDEKRKVKMVLVDTNSIASVAVNDADLMVDMPADLTAATGMDALTHAIEGYITKGASPFTDMFNLEAIKAVSKNLERAVKDGSDIEAREGMAYGQFITGMGFSNCGLGIVHSMAHQLGGFYDLPHGVCNAILLPYVMEYNAPVTGDKYRDIAEAMGVDTEGMDTEEARAACIDAVKKLSVAVGIPEDFTTLGVKKEDVDQLADFAMVDACTPGNPRDPKKEDMVELYQKVF
jgi:alcohol dehydrogenase